ncbi:unnamed protein product [Moneuplotes crassus]|uniref:Tetratricopeptide repeat protein n=1 Tax=Euplotes crassus TaxID=5936 RepID=A0AAD1U7E6_EUPCR|nr:unnamed protein product [Moneuplotes crassus]
MEKYSQSSRVEPTKGALVDNTAFKNNPNYNEMSQPDNKNNSKVFNREDLVKAGSFASVDSDFFKSLDDYKSDLLFNQTESILSKPPNIYRQTLDVDNLISVCSKKLKEDYTHKKALFIRASSLLKKNQVEDAINDCNTLIELDPENAGAFYIRGCCYQKNNDLEEAIEDYTTVLEIDPNHINAAYARGACENKRGNFDKAIEDYHMALEKDQERPTSPKQRASLQNKMGIEGFTSTINSQSDRNYSTQDQVQSN